MENEGVIETGDIPSADLVPLLENIVVLESLGEIEDVICVGATADAPSVAVLLDPVD